MKTRKLKTQNSELKTIFNHGFTMIEILVAMVILVLAFGLVTMLYVRASKIRRIITMQNNVQEVLSQMINTIAYGEKINTLKNLGTATTVYELPVFPTVENLKFANYALIFGNVYEPMVQYYVIAPGLANKEPSDTGTDTTLWHGESSGGEPSTWRALDVREKIILDSGSQFECFNVQNLSPGTDSETTFVKITLRGRSSDPSMKDTAPVTLQTGVRLKNKTSF